MTDAPRITDEEIRAFWEVHAGLGRTREALSAFLAARVPDAWKPSSTDDYTMGYTSGFNACRDIVLNGRAEGK